MAADSTPTPLIVQPFTVESEKDFTKDDLIAHLSECHKRFFHNTPTSTTKARMIEAHAAVHEAMETGTEQQRDRMKYNINLPHVHRVITADDLKGMGIPALNLAKPLTSSEATALRGLIENDFAALAQDMRAMAADARRDRIEQVEKEWAARKDRSGYWTEKARKYVQRVDEDVAEMVKRAADDGVQLNVKQSYTREITTVLVGKSQALNEATAEVENDLKRALITLERQKLQALRQVILARITPEAQEVLNAIPSAKTLMVEAAQERAAQKQVEGVSA